MRLKNSVFRRTLKLQVPELRGRKALPLRPAVVTQKQLKELHEALDRFQHLQDTLRHMLFDGVEIEAGRYSLGGELHRCPECGCLHCDCGSFAATGKYEGVWRPAVGVHTGYCPRCVARRLITSELLRAAAQQGPAVRRRRVAA